MLLDLFHDGRNTASVVEHLSRPFTCWTDIQKIMGSSVEAVKGITGDLKAELMGDRRDM